MPVFQGLVDFNKLFNQLQETPIILNDLKSETEEDREINRNLITSKFTSDMVSLKPSCLCGETKSESLMSMRCPKCGTLVQSSLEAGVEPLVWYRRPGGEDSPLKLISPIILIMLKDRIKKRGFDVLQWLLDTSYNPNTRRPKLIDEIIKRGIKRGYLNFVTNFHEIIDTLFSIRELQVRRGEDFLLRLIKENPDKIFFDYLPVPNKTILIIEPTNMGVFVDPTVIKAINAIEMLTSIDVDLVGKGKQRVRENRLAKATMSLIEVYENIFADMIAPKRGIMRRHVYGSRTIFSFRAVITSITGPHESNVILVPWGVSCGVLRPMIVNKLMRRGFDLNSALGYIYGHIYKHSDLLEEIFEELIAESPGGKGIPVLMQRNPSLLPGSALNSIMRIKYDPKDQALSTSILTVTSMNADFDGDALNFSLALDNRMAEAWSTLDACYTNIEFTKPLELSGNFTMPKPVVSTISNWLEQDK